MFGFIALFAFLRPILLLDLHVLHDSFINVFNFEELQLLLNAFVSLQEN